MKIISTKFSIKDVLLIFQKSIYPLLILFAIFLWFILTETGLKTSFWLLKQFIPGKISVSSLKGKWIDRVYITNLIYQNNSKSYSVTLKNLNLKPYTSNLEINDAEIKFNSYPIKPIYVYTLKTRFKWRKILNFTLVRIENLEGEWDQLPLKGSGQIEFQEKHKHRSNLKITLGENEFKFWQDPQNNYSNLWSLKLKNKENHKVELNGALTYYRKLKEWQGNIAQLNAVSELFGKWKLQEPCNLKLSNKTFTLNTLTIQHENAALATLFISWCKLNGFNIKMDAPSFPLQYSKLHFQGNLGFHLAVSQILNKHPLAKTKLTLFPGTIKLNEKSNHLTQIPYLGGFLQLNLEDNQIKGQLELQENRTNSIKAAFHSIPNTNTQPILEQSLQGTINGEYKDFKFISSLTPIISKLKAELTLLGDLSGNIKKPIFQLNAKLKNASFFIPKQAVQVSRLNVNLEGKIPGNINLLGDGYAGNGKFILKSIQNTQNFKNLQLEFSGNNIQIYDTSYIQAKASPNLKLYYIDKALHVEGTVRITDASVTIKDEKNTINASKDIIFINSDEKSNPVTPLQIIPSLYVILENRMHFKGYGLDGIIGGKLAIEKRPDGLLSGMGRLTIKEGKYRLQGATRYIYRGYLLFPPGTLLMDPVLDIRILQKRVDVTENNDTVGIYVQGTLQKPFLNPYSSSNLQSNEILSRLGFGNTQSSTDESQKQLLSQTAFLLAGNSNPFIDLFQSHLELEEFNIESRETHKSFNTQGGTDTVLVLGKSLSKKLYLQYLQSVLEPISTVRLKYSLSPRFSTSIETGTEGLGGDLNFSLEKD